MRKIQVCLISIFILALNIPLNAEIFPLGSTFAITVSTYDSSGARANADGNVTCAAFQATSDTPVVSANLVNISTGLYRGGLDLTTGNGVSTGMGLSIRCDGAVASLEGSKHVKDGIYIIGTPAVSGLISSNTTHFGGTAGTFAAGRPETNISHISGAAVNTNTAQLGVNIVNYGGTAGTFAGGRPQVNTSHIAGSIVNPAVAQIGTNVVNFGGAAGTFASGRPEVSNMVGNVSGSVGSVTGNVSGSVNSVVNNVGGNVAGNVVGSVGSVTGNVGGNLTGTVGGLSVGALADLFDTNSGTTYAASVAGSVVKEIVDNAAGSTLTVEAIADAVWDEATVGHQTAGTTGKALTDASSAGDPWSTAIPGSYTSGSAGFIVGTNLNSTISSRATQTSVDVIDTNVDSVLTIANKIDSTLEVDGSNWRFTADSLANAETEAVIADGSLTSAKFHSSYSSLFTALVKEQTDPIYISLRSTGVIRGQQAVFAVGPFRTLANFEAFATGTPVCTKTIDNVGSPSSLDFAVGAIGSTGYSIVTLSEFETGSINNFLLLSCTRAGVSYSVHMQILPRD